jgi:hypothetical protein
VLERGSSLSFCLDTLFLILSFTLEKAHPGICGPLLLTVAFDSPFLHNGLDRNGWESLSRNFQATQR